MGKQIYQYFVEGENEKCFVDVLKSDLRCIEAGKVEIFNAVQNSFTAARIRTLKKDTIVVLVYDTDTDSSEILKMNIGYLQSQKAIKEVICIPQVENFEDVLTHACEISKAQEITHSKTKKDFKRDLIRCSNLARRLEQCQFNKDKLWTKIPKNSFKQFGNGSARIKK